jgi:hypothetical protein
MNIFWDRRDIIALLFRRDAKRAGASEGKIRTGALLFFRNESYF